jgi:ribose transport system ATP-binding protein
MLDDRVVLRGQGLSKRFGDVPVLAEVDFSVSENQVIGMVGENGAGKTTLFNILSGTVRADAGSMELHGAAFSPASYREASALGVSRVFQEQALIPNIKVYENLLLSHEAAYARAGQWVDKPRMIATAQRVIDEAGLDIDVRLATASYSFSKRQLIEIARACLVPTEVLGLRHPVVLLDEPTSALEKSDEAVFRRLINRLRDRSSIVLVSHRLTEVLELSDIVYVLKDGRLVATLDPDDADERMLHGLMVGRAREADFYHEHEQLEAVGAQAVFQVRGLSRTGQYDDMSLEVGRGEVVGLGGLLNSGKSEIGKGAAGIVPPESGTVVLDGAPPERPVIRHLTRRGLGYVPAERLLEGLISTYSAAWNLSLAGGADTFTNRLGLWQTQKEVKVTQDYIAALSIKARGPHDVCATLSGGNQQKIVLARWLCRDPRVLILDNPTRGVDAGAKEEIYKLIRGLCSKGVGILLITDDLLELIGLSNRIMVMQNGRIVRVVEAPARAKPSERALIEAMLSQAEGQAVEGSEGRPPVSPAAGAGNEMGAAR